MTIDQTYSDTLLLRYISNIPDSLSLYNYADWSGVDYCYQNECVDINGDGIVNVVDIVAMVAYILGNNVWSNESAEFLASDMNEDGIINVVDIVGVVSDILGS